VTSIIVILAVALVLSLAFNMGFFGGNKGASSPSLPASTGSSRSDDGLSARLAKAESDLEKKRKEVEESKKALGDAKDELKTAKRRLHDLKASDKDGDDLKKARADVERQASMQLESTRAELAAALADVQRLRNEIDVKGKKPLPRPEEPKEERERPAPLPVQRVIRELSDSEKERIARLETQSSNDRRKAIELEREVRNLKAKVDKQLRDVKAAFTESTLAKDKFRAVEKRLNRTLLESDLLRRALFDLEKKTGTSADRAALTPEEIAASDKSMADKHAAEDQAAADARAKLEAQHAQELEAAHAAAEAAKAAAAAPPPTEAAEAPPASA
jgi:hypothetical protein